jgi:diadenosine tetraphosphatase ApaH/serine/threonine PP2A family protein phosphatase
MRVAVLSDIHSNLVALEAVLGAVGSVDAFWVLGDTVGYGPDPDGVVDRLRSLGAVAVKGNHDAAAVGGDEIEWFNPDARAAIEWTRRRIATTTRDWLAGLPVRRTEQHHLLVHGSPREPIWEYVVSVPIARANLASMEERICLHGHTHVPMVYAEHDGRVEAIAPRTGSSFHTGGRRALVNPGSVGQPRDGDPAASFLVVDMDAELCTWQRVAYDIAAVMTAMADAGLPRRLAERLSYGV